MGREGARPRPQPRARVRECVRSPFLEALASEAAGGGEAARAALRELVDALSGARGGGAAAPGLRDGFNSCTRLLRAGGCAGLLLFAPPGFREGAREQRGRLSAILQALHAQCVAYGVPYLVLGADSEPHSWFCALLRRRALTCVALTREGPGVPVPGGWEALLARVFAGRAPFCGLSEEFARRFLGEVARVARFSAR